MIGLITGIPQKIKSNLNPPSAPMEPLVQRHPLDFDVTLAFGIEHWHKRMKCGRFTPRYLYIGAIEPVMKTTGHVSALPKLFSPIRIGDMTVKNRLAMAPIGTLYSSLDGAVRQEFKDVIIARAQGGVGMIMLADGQGSWPHGKVAPAAQASRAGGEAGDLHQGRRDQR